MAGKFAHFRAFDTTRQNITYPFPPRTSILGMIGAMAGVERNSYWEEGTPLGNSLVGLQILNPIKRSSIKVNYLQTRNVMNIKGLKIMVPKDPFEVESKDQRGFNMPVALNILRDVRFRIYFHSPDDNFYNEIKSRLEAHKYAYPPYLGHANMLATVKLAGEFDANPLPEGEHQVQTVVPTSALDLSKIELYLYGFTVLYKLPNSLVLDGRKITLKNTSDVIFNAAPGQAVKAIFASKKVFSLKDAGNNNNTNIVFFENN